jgi:hypothetical protein
VPWVKVDPSKKFLPHYIEWYAHNKVRHNLRQHFEMYRPLYEVQEEAVDLAIKWKASHVLFVEDDHWGFPVDGLDVLLEEDKDVVGFQTFRKKWPYSSLAMQKNRPELTMIGRKDDLLKSGLQLLPHDRGAGSEVQFTDILTWAFTLVKTNVFERLYAAGKRPFDQQGPVPTDSYFNQYCQDIGINRHIHFGFQIAHGEHDPEDLPLLREIESVKRQAQRNKAKAQIWHLPGDPPLPTDIEWNEKLAAFKATNAEVLA